MTRILLILSIALLSGFTGNRVNQIAPLKISANHRYFTDGKGKPFFWLGDTGWLLCSKLNREDVVKYLNDRKAKGFNVIQTSMLHGLNAVNAYNDSALINRDISKVKTSADSDHNNYWNHIDFIIDEAARRGIYMALVPTWGSGAVKSGHVTLAQAKAYATFLAERYKNKPNIIWLNGGDVKGADSIDVWNTIGSTLRAKDPNHLITFHPRGRSTSSIWFHNEAWLDFNMFQSGHKDYRQDTMKNDTKENIGDIHFGEDNWKFVQMDYTLTPVKPTIEGEPSYETIPHGLHDSSAPRWKDCDVRRYGYWAVFAGGAGYTYGNNAIMQFHKKEDKSGSYGVNSYWQDELNAPGASQMIYLKNLMLSKPYFDRVPDQSLIAGDQGKQYNYVIATRGKNYAFAYTYTGRTFSINMGKISGAKVKASWYSPRDGKYTSIGTFTNKGVQSFDPPGEQKEGNDWVLVLEGV
ncbi:glycoside hydrolase family 140 protein [Pinibacter aurantiacus]|uniref:Glycoside hydrolase family 140 protein n=1 Tax=Pinibacter aurantiacus TaxID=2851599 RepID=A0A9E2W866_9BACT|nr:glycoside hydrolase family 140 protein [Pinibacter aurantiacus]MBV4357647.1 glycoside hydrolase family 140 protein [Pinibacter aurantiacus]